jgi:hypothetical protein
MLSSSGLAVILFLTICLLAIPGTFTESRKFYSSFFFLACLGLLGTSTVLCTIKRRKTLSWPVVLIHGGVIIVLLGAVASSFGSVATVNIYEGTTVREAYRWDLQADVPLGMELTVAKINMEYYPAPVKVGVLNGVEKIGLYTLETGKSFQMGDYTVTVGNLDPATENLHLTVADRRGPLGTVDTAGERKLPAGFPFDFRLVSYKNPKLKRMWINLRLSRDATVMAEGTSEVNSPFHWDGLDFFHVQTDSDATGRAFAGIQIVRDPGRPLVFAGLATTALGTLLIFARRFYGHC